MFVNRIDTQGGSSSHRVQYDIEVYNDNEIIFDAVQKATNGTVKEVVAQNLTVADAQAIINGLTDAVNAVKPKTEKVTLRDRHTLAAHLSEIGHPVDADTIDAVLRGLIELDGK